jgi:flagellar motor protein MotB
VRKIALLISALFLLQLGLVFADSAQIGTTANNFLKIMPPAKASSMGDAYIAVGDDIDSIYYNPAGMGKSMLHELSFTHVSWFQSVNYDSLSALLPFSFGNIGVALNYLNVGSMYQTDALGNTTATMNPNAMQGILNYSKEFSDNFFIGGNLKIMNYSIDSANPKGSSMSMMVDLGILYDISFLKGLSAAITVKNVGPGTQYVDSSFLQPFSARGGLGFTNQYLKIEADAEYVNDNDLNYYLGASGTLFDVLSIRAGWKGGTINQFTAGAGVELNGFDIDYAYVPFTDDDLGITNRVTLSYKFGTPDVKLTMTPKVFSPNNDKILDFTFGIANVMSKSKIKSAYITIYDAFNNVVKRAIPVNNWNRIYWNGYNDFKQRVADGTYRAVLTVNYGAGIKSTSEPAPVEVDCTPPTVDGDANPKIIKPGTMTTLVVPVSFTEMAQDLHGIGAWKIIIGTMDGKVFKTFSGRGDPLGVTWDGSDDTGLKSVSTKTTYTYTFYAMDSVGNWGRSATKQVKVLPKEIVINLAADTLFDIGKADVKISVYQDLQKIADIIKSNGNPHVIVEGHTDNVPMKHGKYPDNMALSQARAEAVVKFFVELFDFNPSIFTAAGKGDTQPIATNDTPEGRKANRRVTLRIQASKYE